MCVGNVFERCLSTWTFSPYGLAPIFVAVSIMHNTRNYNNMYKKNLAPTVSILESIQNLPPNLRDTLTDTQWDDKTKCFYRLHLPFEKSWSNLWRDHIECSTFQADPCDSHFEEGNNKGCLIRIDASEGQIHVFQIHVENMGFLIIESQFPCTYNDMNRYRYAISLSFGLVTTVALLDYTIVMASETVEFDNIIERGVVQLRPTIKSQYRFFTTDLYGLGWLRHKVDYDVFRPYCDEKGNLKGRLDPMTEQEFSGLVSMLHRSKDLARATMMLLVASNDIEYLGPLYSVVLETVTLVITEEKKELFSDYTDAKGEKRDIYNSEKLKDPFERIQQIGYELSGIEKQIIKSRNKYLHGTLPEGGENIDELLYNCIELRKLCGILLFRYAGYKGPILNNAVERRLEKALANKEPLFITYDEEAAKELVKKRKNEKRKEKEEKNNKQSQGKNNNQSQGNEKSSPANGIA